MMNKVRMLVLVALLLGAVMLPHTVAAACDGQFFSQTNHCVPKIFADYWAKHGGLVQQGYPVSEAAQEVNALDGKSYLTQYFERAVFEQHAENKSPYDVLLAQVGGFRYKAKYPQGAQAGYTWPSNNHKFDQTGFTVGGKFYDYWQAHGGLAQQGLPISAVFEEKSDSDGKTYLVQYFERAEFEWHKENAGTANEVLLTLLGAQRFAQVHGNGGGTAGDDNNAAGIAGLSHLKSYHLLYAETQNAGGFRSSNTLEGDFISADKAKFSIENGGLKTYYILIGSDTYTSSDGSNYAKHGEARAAADKFVGAFTDVYSHASRYPDYAAAGDETIAGEDCAHLSTTTIEAGYPGVVDTWVAKSDHTVRQLQVSFRNYSQETITSFTISNVGGVAEITAP